jgi:hypothetical protein
LLQSLHLTDVLIGGAPAKKWVIRAPNLRHFTICSEINDGWILKELTSLRSALVRVSDFLVDHHFAKFLSGLAQVTKLMVINDIRVILFYLSLVWLDQFKCN